MSAMEEPHVFLSVVEAAAFLGLSRGTLDNLRWQGGGPAYRKHGGRVLYTLEALKHWSKSREHSSTSD